MSGLAAIAFVMTFETHAASPRYPVRCPADQVFRRSPCVPTAEEKSRIMAAVEAAFKAQSDMARLTAREAETRARAQGGSYEDKEAWEAVSKDFDAARQKVRAKFERAMVLTQQLYGVGPAVKGGEPQGGLFQHNVAHWRPQLWDEEESAVYQAKTSDGRYYFMTRFKDGDFGVTEDNGDVFLSMSLFRQVAVDKDPLQLALTLQHEGGHFAQLVEKGWPSYHATEAAALKAEHDAALAVLGPDDDRTKGLLSDFQAAGRAALDPKDPSAYLTEERNLDNLEAWMKDVQGQRAILKRLVETERESRRARAEAERREARNRADKAQTTLEDLSRLFCSNLLYIQEPDVSRWIAALGEADVQGRVFADLDNSYLNGWKPTCAHYVAFQALFLRTAGRADWTADDIQKLVVEGNGREWGWLPRGMRPPGDDGRPDYVPPVPSVPPPPEPQAPRPPEPGPPDRPTRPSPPACEPCLSGSTCCPR